MYMYSNTLLFNFLQDMLAMLQEECGSPTCSSPAIYDPDTCMCMTLTAETADTTCPQGYQRASISGECVCATAVSVFCESGYNLDYNNNCGCSNGLETKDSLCPEGSYRPAATACYCIALQEPTCSKPGGIVSNDGCSCAVAELSTPTCSNSEICLFDSEKCSCELLLGVSIIILYS